MTIETFVWDGDVHPDYVSLVVFRDGVAVFGMRFDGKFLDDESLSSQQQWIVRLAEQDILPCGWNRV